MVRTINLKKLKAQDAEKLFQFFEEQAKNGVKFWQKNKIYEFGDGTKFYFKNDIYQRTRKDGHQGVRYEAISNKAPLGRGVYGIVKKIKGTLALALNSFKFKKHHKNGLRRAVKIQNQNVHKERVEQEYQLTRLAPHMAMKEPTIVQHGPQPDNCDSYTTMDLFPGKELRQILEEDRSGVRVLTTAERIQLTSALLYALKTQVKDCNLVHRDIKPENIIVDLGPPIRVNIVDFQISMQRGKPDGKRAGTPLYLAPEVNLRPMSTSGKSDVFSLGRVIAEIWHVGSLTYGIWNNLEKFVSYTAEQRVKGLFYEINDLQPADANIIRTMLKSMLESKPRNRITIEEAITQFERIDLKNYSRPIQTKPSARSLLSLFSIFSPPSERLKSVESKGSCFTREERKQIALVITQLQKEIDSWWPYPNKSRKRQKVAGLTALINYSKDSANPLDALDQVEKEFKDLTRGHISVRTANLLKDLRSNYQFIQSATIQV